MLCWVDVWAHDRWRIPLPAGHKFPIDKYRLLRERVQDSVTVLESEPVPWEWLAAVHEAPLLERIRTGTMTRARAARPRAAVVGGARRARPALGRRHRGRGAAGAGARHRHEPRRRHPPRGPRLRPRLLPVQRRRRHLGAPALGGRRAARARRRLRRPPGRRHGPAARARTRTRSRSRCTAPATTRSSASRPTSTSTCPPAPATTSTCGSWTSRSTPRSPPARPRSRSSWPAPTRGRATASAASR